MRQIEQDYKEKLDKQEFFELGHVGHIVEPKALLVEFDKLFGKNAQNDVAHHATERENDAHAHIDNTEENHSIVLIKVEDKVIALL